MRNAASSLAVHLVSGYVLFTDRALTQKNFSFVFCFFFSLSLFFASLISYFVDGH